MQRLHPEDTAATVPVGHGARRPAGARRRQRRSGRRLAAERLSRRGRQVVRRARLREGLQSLPEGPRSARHRHAGPRDGQAPGPRSRPDLPARAPSKTEHVAETLTARRDPDPRILRAFPRWDGICTSAADMTDEQVSDGFSADGGSPRLRRRQRHPDREDRDGLREGDLPEGLQAAARRTQLMGNSVGGHDRGGVRDEDRQQLPQPAAARCRTRRTTGRAKYDQAQVDACLTALRAATCRTLTDDPQPRRHSRLQLDVRDAAGGGGRQVRAGLRVHRQRVPEGRRRVGRRVRGRRGRRRVVHHRSLRAEPDPATAARRQRSTTRRASASPSRTNGGACIDGFDCKSRNCVAPTAPARRPARPRPPRSASTAAAAPRRRSPGVAARCC